MCGNNNHAVVASFLNPEDLNTNQKDEVSYFSIFGASISFAFTGYVASLIYCCR